MTPRLMDALLDRRADEIQRADYRAGTIAATTAQVHGTRHRAEDFFPSLRKRTVAQTDDEMLAAVTAWNEQLTALAARATGEAGGDQERPTDGPEADETTG